MVVAMDTLLEKSPLDIALSQLVVAVEKSGNTKVGEINITYGSQEGCPTRCPLKNSGCYAEGGHMRFTTSRVNKASRNVALLRLGLPTDITQAELDEMKALNEELEAQLEAAKPTPEDIALVEAAKIRAMKGKGVPLRLHGVGDCSTPEATRMVAEASMEYDGPVYTYTHAAPDVPRENWLDVSVLASCETIEETIEAMNNGYAAALVVEEYENGRKPYIKDGVLIQPCPQMTTPGVTCNSCRLCMNDKKLLSQRRVIAFKTHGQSIGKARRAVASKNRKEN